MKYIYKKQWALLASSCVALTMGHLCQAAVIVEFEQVGNDVVATWTGALDPGTFAHEGWWGTSGGGAEPNLLIRYTAGAHMDVFGGGAHSTTSLHDTNATYGSSYSGAQTYGFHKGSFYYSGVLNGIQDPANDPIDFDISLHTMTYNSVTLADMGAASFNNTLAWTSSSGDTIHYSTIRNNTPFISELPGYTVAGLGGPALRANDGSTTSTSISSINFTAVPEPSSLLLCGISGLALLARRRR